MNTYTRVSAFLTLILLSLHGYACTEINALPAVINSPGQYCLTADVVHTTGEAGTTSIMIQSKDVLLDLGGHSLSCGINVYGIYVTGVGLTNVQVRNGTVRNCAFSVIVNNCGGGCEINNMNILNGKGILISKGSGAVIRANYLISTALDGEGIDVGSSNSLVSGNFVTGYRNGIYSSGSNNVIRSNTISACSASAINAKTPITYMDNLTSGCATPFVGSGISASVNAGGNY